jgi:nucleotide-binding universal stress UspA family protein
VLYGTCVQVLLTKSKSPKVSQVELKKLLLPLDGSPFAEAPITFIDDLTKGTKTEIVLTTVCEPPLVPSYGDRPINPAWKKHRDELWAATQQQASEYLNKVKTRLEKQGMKIKSQVIPGELGRIAESIMQVAQKEKVDLIAMTTHGRSGVSRWVYGGVANRIVEESLQTVLLIRPSVPK